MGNERHAALRSETFPAEVSRCDMGSPPGRPETPGDGKTKVALRGVLSAIPAAEVQGDPARRVGAGLALPGHRQGRRLPALPRWPPHGEPARLAQTLGLLPSGAIGWGAVL